MCSSNNNNNNCLYMLKIYQSLEDRRDIIDTLATCRNCELLLSTIEALLPRNVLPTFVLLLHITIPQTNYFLVTPKMLTSFFSPSYPKKTETETETTRREMQ